MELKEIEKKVQLLQEKGQEYIARVDEIVKKNQAMEEEQILATLQKKTAEIHLDLQRPAGVSSSQQNEINWNKRTMETTSQLLNAIYPNEFTGQKQTKWQSLQFGHCVPLQSIPVTLDIPLVIVTAASANFWFHLQNFVGAVHTWENQTQVVVYDLGLSQEQILEVSFWCRVTLEPFPFEKYPPHFQNLRNFAWKALVVKSAVEKFGKILYLDSGYEMRRPIDYIKSRIDRGTYFCTGMGDTLTRGTRWAQYNFFHATAQEFIGRPMTAGGKLHDYLFVLVDICCFVRCSRSKLFFWSLSSNNSSSSCLQFRSILCRGNT